MNTFALWYAKNEDNDNPKKIDVHFNLWKAPKKPCINQPIIGPLIKKFRPHEWGNDYFLDVGFMVYNITNISDIKFYVPFQLDNNQVCDLGNIMKDEHKLINGIFNEKYYPQPENVPSKMIRVKEDDEDDRELFTIYSLKKDDEELIVDKISQENNQEENTLITINTTPVCRLISQSGNSERVYFRFRILINDWEKLIGTHRSPNSFFENVFTTTEVIDFRLNEKRTYSDLISSRVIHNEEFYIQKIHFLLLRHSNDDFISTGVNPSCRVLEENIWEPYINEGTEKEYEDSNIVAYHLKKKIKSNSEGDEESELRSIDSFNSLIKVRFGKTNLIILIKYFIYLLIGTVMLNWISTFSYKKVGKELMKKLINVISNLSMGSWGSAMIGSIVIYFITNSIMSKIEGG